MSPARSSLHDASDALLATRAADGDVDAFEVLARRFGPMMRVYAAKMLGSDVESDDVVQEVFVTAWRKLDTLSDPAVVRSWLMRMVTHRCIDRMRVRRHHVDIDEHELPARPDESPEHVAERRARWRAMSAALDRLPDDQRHAWIMRELGGESYGAIAGVLRVPTSTVRGLLARARATLTREMEAWR